MTLNEVILRFVRWTLPSRLLRASCAERLPADLSAHAALCSPPGKPGVEDTRSSRRTQGDDPEPGSRVVTGVFRGAVS